MMTYVRGIGLQYNKYSKTYKGIDIMGKVIVIIIIILVIVLFAWAIVSANHLTATDEERKQWDEEQWKSINKRGK